MMERVEAVAITRGGRKPARWSRAGELLFGALATADEEHHVEIEGLGEVRCVAGRDHALQHEQGGAPRHVSADVVQDLGGLLIVEVVDARAA